jgi:arabinofuranosyltransferase
VSGSWSRRIALFVFLASSALGAYAVRSALPGTWESRWVQDDAYISFRYAKHLVQGHGLVYNVGERVEGYTNFLWTVLAAIPLTLGREDPIGFMHGLSLALWLASYLSLLLLGVRLGLRGLWAAPLALAPLTFHWSFNQWFFSGMETPLVSALTILAVCFFSLDPERLRWAPVLSGACLAALVMTRPDGVVVLFGLVLCHALLQWRPIVVGHRWRPVLVPLVAPILLVLVPFTLWRIGYYGSFYPNTYYAKVAYLTFYSRGWEYLRTYLGVYELAPYLPLVVLGALAAQGEARRFLWGSLAATLFAFAYVVRLGGDFMEWRFLTPVSGVLYPAVVVGAGCLVERLVRTRQGVRDDVPRFAAALAAIVVSAFLARSTHGARRAAQDTIVSGQETIGLLARYCDPRQYNWREVGKLLDSVLPPDVRIATTSAGIIPFYCDRPCLDLHGMNDPVIAHGAVDPGNRGRMGHEHWLQDHDEMRRRGVDVYVNWADPKNDAVSRATPARPDLELVSARLPDDRYVEFLILNHAAIDMDRLRQDPRLVFYEAGREGDRRRIHTLAAALAGLTVIDALNIRSPASERAHGFREIAAPDSPYTNNNHTKVLGYRPPDGDIVLQDDGLRIFHQAEWVVSHVRSGRRLLVVARWDQTNGARYRLEVNGRLVPGSLALPGGPEAWNEALIEVPAELLRDGDNRFLLTRERSSESDAELYYLWFLQAAGKEASSLVDTAEPDPPAPVPLDVPPGRPAEPARRAADKHTPHAMASRLSRLALVDSVDVQDGTSERDHDFVEDFAPGAPYGHNYHQKTLGYASPLGHVTITDEGRRIFHQARWTVDGVRPGVPLRVVARHDHSLGGSYALKVNGARVPGLLVLPGGPRDAFDEAAIEVPGSMLATGANRFELTRVSPGLLDAEIYYLWFYQPRREASAR